MSMREHNAYLVGWTALSVVVTMWAFLWWTSDEGRAWRRRTNACLERRIGWPYPVVIGEDSWLRSKPHLMTSDPITLTAYPDAQPPLELNSRYRLAGIANYPGTSSDYPSTTVLVFRPVARPYDWALDGEA